MSQTELKEEEGPGHEIVESTPEEESQGITIEPRPVSTST